MEEGALAGLHACGGLRFLREDAAKTRENSDIVCVNGI